MVNLNKQRGLCEDCEHELEITLSLFQQALTWDEMHRLMRAFLNNQIRFSAGHCGPLDPETTPLKPGLHRVMDFGFVTLDSQPEEHFIWPLPNGEWSATWQRAWLEAAIPTTHPDIDPERLLQLINKLMEHPKLHTVVYSAIASYPEVKDITIQSHLHAAPLPAEGREDDFFVTQHLDPDGSETASRLTLPYRSKTERKLAQLRTTMPREGWPSLRQELVAKTREELDGVDSPMTQGGFDPDWVLDCTKGGELDRYIKDVELMKELRPIMIYIMARELDAGTRVDLILAELCEEVGMLFRFTET
jgi:hypothetical protein